MKEIMDTCAWKTPVTFARFYLKDLAGKKGRFGRSVLLAAGARSNRR